MNAQQTPDDVGNDDRHQQQAEELHEREHRQAEEPTLDSLDRSDVEEEQDRPAQP